MKLKITIDNSKEGYFDVRHFEIEEPISITYSTTDGQRVTIDMSEDDDEKTIQLLQQRIERFGDVCVAPLLDLINSISPEETAA